VSEVQGRCILKALGEEKKEAAEKLKFLALEGDAEEIVNRLMKKFLWIY